MKNILKKLVFVLLLGANFIFGQEINPNPKTPYEKKVVEIYTKYLQRFGVSNENINKLIKGGSEMVDKGLTAALLEYRLKGGRDIVVITESLRLELAGAKALMTAEEKKREEDRERRAAAERYAKKSELGRIKEKIRKEFEEWVKQGEFEKREEYSERLSRYKERYLNTIILQEFINGINLKTIYREQENMKYNPDKEIYVFEMYRMDRDKLRGWIRIEPNLAREFVGLKPIERDYLNNYALIDMYIYPIKGYEQNSKKIYEINYQEKSTKLSDFSISTDDLGLSQYFGGENKVIKLSEIKSLVMENGEIVEKRKAMTSEDTPRRCIVYYPIEVEYGEKSVDSYYSYTINENGDISGIELEFNKKGIMTQENVDHFMDSLSNKRWILAVENGEYVKDRIHCLSRGIAGNNGNIDYKRSEIIELDKEPEYGNIQGQVTKEPKKGGKVGRFLGNVLKEVLTD